MATDTDPLAAYLADAARRAEHERRFICAAPEGPAWSCEDVPLLLKAVQAALATHPVHDNGIAPAWCVPCTNIAQASQRPGPESSVFVYAADCKLRSAIERELLGKDGTDG